jgi:hypothetical protein
MAYDREKIYQQAKEAIEKHKLFSMSGAWTNRTN